MKATHRIWLLFFFIAAITFSCASGMQERKTRSEALRNLGEVYLIEGQTRSALRELIKAERIYSEDPYLQNLLGLAYRENDNLDKAIFHLKRALKLKDDFPNARNNLAVAYMKKQEWDAAIEQLKMLTSDILYTTQQFSWVNLGWAYFNKKDFLEAQKYYRKALDYYEEGYNKDATYIRSLLGLGRTYIEVGKFPEALGLLNQAVLAAADRPEIHFELGRVYRLLKDNANAVNAFLKVIKLSPGSTLSQSAEVEVRLLRKE
jgi:type IV pilus assembly protein PilF